MSAEKKPIDLDRTRDRLALLGNQLQSGSQMHQPPSPNPPRRARPMMNSISLSSQPLIPGTTPPATRPRKKSSHTRAASGGSLIALGLSTGLSSSDASPDGFSMTAPMFRHSATSLASSTSYGSTNSLDQQIDEQKRYTRHMSINGQRYEANADDIENFGQIGHGTTGQVMKMLHRPSRKVMACKVMARNANEEEQKRVLMDLFVMINHNCPHIVESYGSIISQDDVYICMELMSTCLEKLMKRYRKPLPEPILGRIAVAIVLALDYLKEKHDIIHRDIKPSNILLDAERGVFKICDFGISGRLVNSKARTRGAGCAAYMAPERVMPDTASQYDIRADVWSMGITLVELATGEFPYRGCRSEFEVLTRILEDDAPRLPSDRNFSLDFQSFISQCLTKDRDKRPKFRDLKYHAFVKRYESTPVDVCGWYRGVVAATPVA